MQNIILLRDIHPNGMVLAQKQTQIKNRIESPEMKPGTYGQLIYNKGGKNIQIGRAHV